jgi:hypothetical protein
MFRVNKQIIIKTCSTLRKCWVIHEKSLLHSAIIFMSLLAVVRLIYEFHRLVFVSDGAIDLRLRYDEVQQWFAGLPVYSDNEAAVYPPASYILLWPFLKPFSWTMVRWLWALILPVMTGWLIYLAIKESRLKSTRSRITLTLFIIAIYPTVITIGNGQLPLLIIPAFLTGILFIRRQGIGWKQDLWVSFLLLFSLLKPSISVPFFWIVMISGNFIRIVTLVLIGYGILTFWAASFQQETYLALVHQCLQNATIVAGAGGYGNIHSGLIILGLEAWILPVTCLILILLGAWVYYHRHADLWLLLGVTAIVARVWTYHRLYDDLLILLPMITLLRIARQETTDKHSDVVAGILFFCSWLALLAPGTLLQLPFPHGTLFRTGQVLLWISIALFLFYQTLKSNKRRFLANHS